MRIVCAALLLAVTLVGPSAQERPLPEFETFAAEVRKHLATDEERQSGYTFTERRVEQRLDGDGRTRSESVKVYEIYPGLPGEDRYRRLIEEDGRPVPGGTLARQDRDRRKHVEEYARKAALPATSSARRSMAREDDKLRREYNAAIDDLFRVYDIRMVRREAIDGHDAIFATLTPKANVKALTKDGKVMQKFKARAWISESDYELVRVEIEAVDTLSFGFGLLARIHKGTVAAYERRKVNNEAWLPARVTWTASARVALIKRVRVRGISEFSNYKKATVDTSTTYAPPVR
jgi:hypothetical protein